MSFINDNKIGLLDQLLRTTIKNFYFYRFDRNSNSNKVATDETPFKKAVPPIPAKHNSIPSRKESSGSVSGPISMQEELRRKAELRQTSVTSNDSNRNINEAISKKLPPPLPTSSVKSPVQRFTSEAEEGGPKPNPFKSQARNPEIPKSTPIPGESPVQRMIREAKEKANNESSPVSIS